MCDNAQYVWYYFYIKTNVLKIFSYLHECTFKKNVRRGNSLLIKDKNAEKEILLQSQSIGVLQLIIESGIEGEE